MPDACFAARGSFRCNVLTVPKCMGKLNCPFYKTKAQLIQEQCDTNKHLRSLDKMEQLYISEKYMGGKMPWKVK